MMTMHFAEPMPVLEHPLRISGTGSLQEALVCLDRRIVGARREHAVQAVMMTILMFCATLSSAGQMPILERSMPFTGCSRRDSVEMPMNHTSASICCIHDEDDKRGVRLEMRRWSKSEAWSEG
jgi:hypothetical protein